VAGSLQEYRIDDSDWPVTVTTPLASKFDCSSVTMGD